MNYRLVFAESLQSLLKNEISLDEFEESFFKIPNSFKKNRPSDYECMLAIFEIIWLENDNLDLLDKESRNFINLCVKFLESNYEYSWKKIKPNVLDNFLKVISLGGVDLHKLALEKQGDFEYWPFLSKTDFDTLNSS